MISCNPTRRCYAPAGQPAGPTASRRGVSLAEVVVSTLLVALVLVTSMHSVGGVIRTWQASAAQHDGFTLAADLMTEILQAWYIEPDDTPTFGRESGESGSDRTNWDDTDDYKGWLSSPPEAKDGTALSGYIGWTREVQVKKVTVGDPNSVLGDSDSDTGIRRITVTVTDPSGRQTSLVAIRNQIGVMEQAPDEDGTFVVWVGSELQVGAGGQAVRSGTNVTNHARDQ
jgi:hypothetical protein